MKSFFEFREQLSQESVAVTEISQDLVTKVGKKRVQNAADAQAAVDAHRQKQKDLDKKHRDPKSWSGDPKRVTKDGKPTGWHFDRLYKGQDRAKKAQVGAQQGLNKAVAKLNKHVDLATKKVARDYTKKIGY